MTTNPEIVIDAIMNNDGTKTNTNIKIYPCTIRRYAILEKLHSPFIDPSQKFELNSIIPSAYVFACDNDTLKTFTTKDVDVIINKAFDWAENLEMSDIPQMIEIITKQMIAINKAAPSATSESSSIEDGTKKN